MEEYRGLNLFRRGHWLALLGLVFLFSWACSIGVTVCKTGRDCPLTYRCDEKRCQKPVAEGNQPPIARAGADLRVKIGARVRLDASTSSDVNDDSLSFLWSLTKKPEGSKTSIENPAGVQASFLADVPGEYVVRLTVKDALDAADDDEVTVRVNQFPKADAGGDQLVLPGARVELKGSDSSDPDGDPLTFSWSLQKLPEGSRAKLTNAESEVSSFVVDQPGLYIAQLTVSDGFNEDRASLTVQVADPAKINPRLQALEPWRAPTRSIAVVTLHGSDLIQGAKVFFDDKPIASDYRSSKRIIVTLNLRDVPVGGHKLKVQNPGGKDTETQLFQVDEVPTPQLSTIKPDTGTAGQSVKVELLGSGFVLGARVFFLEKPVNATYVDMNRLQATLSLAGLKAGSYEIVVENDPGKRSKPRLFNVIAIPPTPRIYRHTFTPGGSTGHIDTKYEQLRLYANNLTQSVQLFVEGRRYAGALKVTITSPGNLSGYVDLPAFNTKGFSAGTRSFVLKNVSPGHIVESNEYRISFADPNKPVLRYLRFFNSSIGATEQEYPYLDIVGSNLLSNIEIFFDGKQYTGKFRQLNSSTIRIEPFSTKGIKVGQHECYVRNIVDGKPHASNTLQFQLQDGRVPLIRSVTSSNGNLFTGRQYTFLRIFGSNFTADAKVLFDGLPHPGPVQVDQGTQIYLYQFSTEKFQPGSHTVVVRNTIDKKDYNSKVFLINIQDGRTPRIRSVSFSPSSRLFPDDVYQARMNVENALPNAKILLDGKEYAGSVQLATTIILLPQFETKGMSVGSHSLQLRNTIGGQPYDSNSYLFSVQRRSPPRLSSITPSVITSKSITRVSLLGSQFSNTSKVFIDGKESKIFSVSFSVILVDVDPSLLKEGRYGVKVTNADGQSSNELFLEVSPDLGPILWGTSPLELSIPSTASLQALNFQLYGFNIQAGAQLLYEGQLIGSINSASSQNRPANATATMQFFTKNGPAKITVKNPDGKESNATEIFLYASPTPEIYSVSPNFISVGANPVFLSISGRGFSQNSKVFFGKTELAASYTAFSGGLFSERLQVSVDANTLASAPDLIPIQVVNSDGTKSIAYSIVKYSATGLRLNYVSPSQFVVGVQNSTRFSISGAGFSPTSQVYMDGNLLPTIYSSSTRLYANPASVPQKPGVYHYLQVKDNQDSTNMLPFSVVKGVFVRDVAPPILRAGTATQLTLSLTRSLLSGSLEIFGKSFPFFGGSQLRVTLTQELSNASHGLHPFYIKFASGEKSQTGAVFVSKPAPVPVP